MAKDPKKGQKKDDQKQQDPNAGTGQKGFVPPPTVDAAVTQLAADVIDGKLEEEATVTGLAQHYGADVDDVQKQLKAAMEAVVAARTAADAAASAKKKADDAAKVAQQAESAAAAAAGKVLVNVPRTFRLRDDATGVVTLYQPGTQRMPAAHADHWYAKQCGVKAPSDE